jgi:type I restriction enzyme S subunit
MKEPTTSKVPQIRFKGFEGEWAKKMLGELAAFSKGQGYSKSDLTTSGIPIVLYGRLYVNYQTSISGVDTFVVEKKGAVKSLGKEVVVPASGETAEDIARASAILTEGIILGGDLNIIYPFNELDSCFLALTLSNGKPQMDLAKRAQGKTIVHVRKADIESILIPFPKRTEQTQIGGYFRELDRLIGLHQRKHDKLLTLKKAMLQKMFPQPGAPTPEIRFKGFSGEWGQRSLCKLTNKVTEKNVAKEHSETFTNSAEFGVISQRDYFDKDISNAENIGGYYIVEPESFVYNPRISVLAPVGPVNRNKLNRTGVMSPLYTVFRTKDVDNTFLEYFFKTNLWHSFMFLNGDTGARADRFSIKDAVFMELPVPYPVFLEQQKIGTYFRTLDELISKHGIQLQKLQQIKSACLEKMFV